MGEEGEEQPRSSCHHLPVVAPRSHRAPLQHPPPVSIAGAELPLLKTRPASAGQGMQPRRVLQGAKGRSDGQIHAFMKKGRLLLESPKGSSVDVGPLGGSAWLVDKAGPCPQCRQQPNLEQRTLLLSLLPAFWRISVAVSVPRWERGWWQALPHLPKGTTEPGQS